MTKQPNLVTEMENNMYKYETWDCPSSIVTWVLFLTHIIILWNINFFKHIIFGETLTFFLCALMFALMFVFVVAVQMIQQKILSLLSASYWYVENNGWMCVGLAHGDIFFLLLSKSGPFLWLSWTAAKTQNKSMNH